jgi:CubicO group peptidase (beta-lactamase class C family)
MSQLHQEYHTHLNKPPINSSGTILTRFTEPLLFEPGTSWQYGSSIDWAGLLVERLTNSNLEDYMREHIWNPLGIKDITFWPDKNPELKARMAGMTIRDPSVSDGKGTVLPYTGPNILAGITDPMGGQGAYASMPSYLKILSSILIDDEKLLKKEISAMMFEPQLTRQSQEALQEVFSSREKSGLYVGGFPGHVKYDWGLGGVLTMEDVNENGVGWRRKGCLTWSGLPNLFWVR